MPVQQEPQLEPKPLRSRYKPEQHVMKLYIPKDEYEQITAFAHPRGFSISGFVRAIISTYCRQQLEKEGRLLRARQIQEANEP